MTANKAVEATGYRRLTAAVGGKRKEYDFTDSVRNPYAKHFRKQVTMRLGMRLGTDVIGVMGSAADAGEKLVAFANHHVAGSGLDVEADERLGVGAADVEPPVRVLHRDAVEFEHVPVGVGRLDAGEDRPGGAGDERRKERRKGRTWRPPLVWLSRMCLWSR